MTVLHLLLTLIVGLRLLAPPGLCLCHLDDLLSDAATHHDDEEHSPGCPASPQGRACLAPTPADLPVLNLSLAVALIAPAVPPTFSGVSAAPPLRLSDVAPHLGATVLRI